jgi:phosphatidylglycerol---prolipoprotein diacylglyceryl transferase
MLIHPQFNPVALQLGPLAIHWYGLTYLAAFTGFYLLARLRLRQPHVQLQGWTSKHIEDLLFFGVVGVILGGRLGYVLFYKPAYFVANPLDIFAVWKGGMAFHGGLLGVVAAMMAFAWSQNRPWRQVTDLIAPCVPLGLACGRVGNFINGELWGRVTDASVPWAMVFPQAQDGGLLRHPSQLYQFAMEGLLLFALLWWYASKPRGLGQVSGMFLMGYSLFRFVSEYFREPDAFLGILALNMTMGQWLCVPMLLFGLLLWILGRLTTQASPIKN